MGGLLAAGQPDYAAGCAWNLGWAGWAERDGQGLFQTAPKGSGPEMRRGLGWAGWAGLG